VISEKLVLESRFSWRVDVPTSSQHDVSEQGIRREVNPTLSDYFHHKDTKYKNNLKNIIYNLFVHDI
jgi:DNA-binding protein Fis